jgi:DHA2 family multidrug resistance protein-like MFS transporter
MTGAHAVSSDGKEPRYLLGFNQRTRAIAIGAVLAAMAIVVIDAGLSTVALPSMAASLHVAPSRVIVVMTAYQVAVVMALLPCAALGERFGFRRIFAIGVALFTAASLASALSPSMPWLIAARFAQGLGGAAILALGVALLRFSVSDARLGAAIGWNALTVALSAAAGPAIGAMIISQSSWHWLYVANIPLGIGVLLATRALPSTEVSRDRLDLISIALNCAAFALFVVGADFIAASPSIAAATFLIGALALKALAHRETPKSRPLVPVDLLRSASFRISVIASICCFTGQSAGLIALPFYLQNKLALPPAIAGLYLTAWPLSVAAMAPLSGRLASRMPTSWLCAVGGGVLTIGLAAAALWPLNGDPRLLVPFTMMCGVGFGLFQVANNQNMFLATPPQRSGAAGAMQGTARLIGQTAGALLVARLFASTSVFQAPQIGMGIGAALTLAAALMSLLRSSSR